MAAITLRSVKGSPLTNNEVDANFTNLNTAIADLQNVVGPSNISESISDIVGGMVSGNTESGISVTYQDADNTLDFDVADFSITLTGDVTGSGTVTNLGNVSFAATVADNSHNHTSGNISDFAEAVADTIGAMVTSNRGNCLRYPGSSHHHWQQQGWERLPPVHWVPPGHPCC